MTGLFQALIVGAALSLLSGALALALAMWQTRRGHGGAGLWRAARWASLTPLLLAPLIYFIPETSVAPMHAPLPDGPGVVGPVAPSAGARPELSAILPAIDLRLVFVLVYGAGLILALGRAFLRHGRRAALLAQSRPAPDIAQDYLSRLASRVGVETPDFRLREGLASPLLTGWNPVILASPDLLDDTAASRYALTHELVHYRRGDEQDRLFGAAIMTALWFHWPLRRIERELHEAREIDCDAESLEALGGAERKPYAATLITMMRSPAQLVSAFGPDDRRHREMRIKAILSGRSARPKSRMLAVMLAGVSILPVACAQAALTERSQLEIDLNNPAGNHVARLHAARHADHDLHFDEDAHVEHQFGPDSPEIDAHENRVLLERLDEPQEPDVVFEMVGTPAAAPLASATVREPGRALAWTDGAGNRVLLERIEEPQEPDVVFEMVGTPAADPRASATVREPRPASPQASPDGKSAPVTRSLQQTEETAPAGFTHPVTEGRVTSHFGNRPARPAGASVFHGGTDIAASTGTPVRAPRDGAVIHAEMGFNGSDRWGNTVVIQHEDGWQTIYAHLDRIDVEVGDVLQAGGALGTVGTTGASTGPHVHVELRHNGERVDPASHLAGLR